MFVLVDGYNLARPEGTGVATYGRSFISASQLLGHRVGVVFGAEEQASRLAAGTRTALQHHQSPVLSIGHRLSRILGSAVSTLGHRGSRIPELEGAHSGDERLPSGVEIWNSYGMFAHSIGAFRKLGHFSTLRLPGVDIAHWTYPLPLRVERAINIYTLHDLVPLLRPELTLDRRGRFRRLCKAIVANADHILTVSESSRKLIIDHLGVAPDRVTNTFQAHNIGADERLAADASSGSVAMEFGLDPGEYFIFAGAIEPKKNIGRLLDAYFRSRSKTPLVIVGSRGWDVDHQLEPLRQRTSAERDRVRLLRYQPRAKLHALIRGAKATFFPSLSEGFGLPALESMALGTALMASAEGGLGEVVGNAALRIDPYDIAAMAGCIKRLDTDPELRNHLTAQGIIRADRFSMDAYAGRLNHVYARLRA